MHILSKNNLALEIFFKASENTKLIQNRSFDLVYKQIHMKKIVIIYAALTVSGVVSAQKLKESEVPAVVQSAFKKNFPAAKGVKWSKESVTEFEAEFKNGSVETAANFDANGKWLITETEIRKAELPAAVQITINKDYAGYDIEEVEKADTPDKGTFYEVELEKQEQTVTLQLSKDGKVLKKIEGKESEEDEVKKN